METRAHLHLTDVSGEQRRGARRRRRPSLVLIALTAAVLLGGSSSATRAATLCVDNTGVCSDVTGTPCYCTLQAAINATSNGDTITVAASTYTVGGLVTVDKTLTLLGAQAGVTACGRAGAESVLSNSQGMRIAASNVVIDGFTVQDSVVAAFTGYGIWMDPSVNVTGTHVVNNIFQNNIVGVGLANKGPSQALIQHNAFTTNNQPGGAGGSGIYTDEFVGGQVTNVLIDANCFTSNENAGVGFSSTDTTKPDSDIEISNNSFDMNGRGIYFFNTNASTVHDNKITNSTVPTDGGTSVAIAVFGDVNVLTILNNDLLTGALRGIRVDNFNVNPNTDVEAHLNNIVGFTLAGLEVGAAGHVGPVNATCNWWGSATGPTNGGNPGGTGDTVIDSGPAIFTPWLIAPAPGGPCLGGVLTPTPTVTPTPPPNPTPTATETPALDHFACFEIHRLPLNSTRVLTDQFGTSTVTIKKAKRLCAPADKNGEDPTAPSDPAHLTSYTIKQTDPPFARVGNVRVANQFGTLTVDVIKPDRLLVPTAKSLTATPPALANPIDHFKCYKVKSTGGFSLAGVNLVTQFGGITVDIIRPLHLCVPVNKNNEDPGAPNHNQHLMCYKVRGPRPQVPDQVFTNNQFGTDNFAVFGPRELCVPSAPPCASAGITLPTQLPNQTNCGPNNQNACNGWDRLGVFPETVVSSRANVPAPARLYEWNSGPTKCFYVYRVPTMGANPTLNGVHCYNTTTCDVCAFDLKTLNREPTWDDLLPASSGMIQDCSTCHAPGPIAPTDPFWEVIQTRSRTLMQTCVGRGGPRWIAAPKSWLKQDVARKFNAPGGCAGGNCHNTGFVRGTNDFCSQVAQQTFTLDKPGTCADGMCDDLTTACTDSSMCPRVLGAMKANGYVLTDPKVCKKFAEDLGCTAAQLGCPAS